MTVLILLLALAGEPLTECAWLAGSWVAADGTEEHWTPAAGGKMFGVNRAFQDGEMVFYEHLVIESREQSVYYLASPKGRQPATPFRLTEASEGRLVFENPQHDFPQKIVYERLNEASFRATISGDERSAEWVFRRR